MSATPAGRSVPSATVLVVEDNPDDRELTLAALAGVAKQVAVARDGVEALDYLFGRGAWSAHPPPAPDLVLLDLKLPRVDGLQVLRRLRDDARIGGTRVVVLTSSDEERDQEGCRQLGVTDYVRKSVDFAQFREQVRRFWPRWTGAGPETF
jgi:CheY-like chemotaxis protein